MERLHVRRAFAHALDREGLVKALVNGHGTPATSIVPPQQWGSVAPKEQVEGIYAGLRKYPFDLAMAREELRQSSVPNGCKASIKYPNSKPQFGKAALNLSENLKQIGIDLEVKEITAEQWLADIYAHEDLGLQMLSTGPDNPDPADYPNVYFASKNAVKNGLNMANYRNPRVDELLQKQESTTDKAVRTAAIGEILKIASDDLAYLPVWWEDVAMAISDRLAYRDFNAFWTFQNLGAHVTRSA